MSPKYAQTSSNEIAHCRLPVRDDTPTIWSSVARKNSRTGRKSSVRTPIFAPRRPLVRGALYLHDHSQKTDKRIGGKAISHRCPGVEGHAEWS
jgi:hypothetical protein